MTVVAQIFGTPASVIPRTLGAFREYYDDQIAVDHDRSHAACQGDRAGDPRRRPSPRPCS